MQVLISYIHFSSQGSIWGKYEGNPWLHRRWCCVYWFCWWQQVMQLTWSSVLFSA